MIFFLIFKDRSFPELQKKLNLSIILVSIVLVNKRLPVNLKTFDPYTHQTYILLKPVTNKTKLHLFSDNIAHTYNLHHPFLL
jgi:hypothetical protein